MRLITESIKATIIFCTFAAFFQRQDEKDLSYSLLTKKTL